jgi:hypothetical protein
MCLESDDLHSLWSFKSRLGSPFHTADSVQQRWRWRFDAHLGTIPVGRAIDGDTVIAVALKGRRSYREGAGRI